MVRLTAKARNALPASSFAGPDRSYPIQDASHARAALSRAAQNVSPEIEAKIKAKVRREYPRIKIEGDASKVRADRSPRRKS